MTLPVAIAASRLSVRTRHQRFTLAMMSMFPAMSAMVIGKLWKEVKHLPEAAIEDWLAASEKLGNLSHATRRAAANAITDGIGRAEPSGIGRAAV